MKKKHFILYVFFLFLFTNCEKDFDSEEIVTNKSNFSFKTMGFNEVTKINKKTALKVLELKSDFTAIGVSVCLKTILSYNFSQF